MQNLNCFIGEFSLMPSRFVFKGEQSHDNPPDNPPGVPGGTTSNELGTSEEGNKIVDKADKALKRNEQVKEDNPLALERVLVMESFRKRVLDSGALDTGFEGDDFTKIEKAKNPVFQYLYEKLDGFFKSQTSTEWPVNRQREWMDAVADALVKFAVSRGFFVGSKKSVDAIIPSYITEGHDVGFNKTNWVPTNTGSFPVWFSKRYPREYQKFFGKAD